MKTGVDLSLVPAAPAEKYRIDFERSHRIYKNRSGERLPGVTTVLDMLQKRALLRWAWQMGKDGKELDAVRQGAADIGTIAHALCEAHLRGVELDRANVTPEMLSKAETGFIRFVTFWDKEGLEVVGTEVVLISERFQVGGTGDVFARRKSDGKLVYVDLKTSKAIYEEMLVQSAVYAELYEEVHGEHVEEVIVARIGKEDADDFESRVVNKRSERVAAFAALAVARRLLQAAGMKV